MNTQHVFPCIKHMERRVVWHWAKGVTAPIVGCSKTEPQRDHHIAPSRIRPSGQISGILVPRWPVWLQLPDRDADFGDELARIRSQSVVDQRDLTGETGRLRLYGIICHHRAIRQPFPCARPLQRSPLHGNYAATLEPRIEAQADQHGKQRTCGSRNAHGQQRIREQLGSQIRPWYTYQGDGHDIVDEADVGASTCGEKPTEAEMDAGEDAVDDIATEILFPAQSPWHR